MLKMIKQSLVALAWVGVFGLSVPAFAEGTAIPEGQAAAKLTALLGQMNSMETRFQQWVEDAKKRSLQDLTGSMWVKRPGKFRWDTNDPYPQTIVTNGETLWIYDKDLEQVTAKKLDAQVGNTPALLLSGDPAKIGKTFTITGTQFKATKEWRFDLKPKSDEALFELLRVHFVDGKLMDMFLRDSLGQTTRIEFATPTLNATIADSLFEFVAPEGVDVIKDM